jgi:hypothetical protein
VNYKKEVRKVDYDSYKKIRKPTAKGTVVLSGIIRRGKDKEREEIEDGIKEWEEEDD